MAAFAQATDLPSGQDEATRRQAALERATDLIRSALGGQLITRVKNDVIMLTGNGRRILQLPQIPVVSVASVVVSLGGRSRTTLTEDVDFTVHNDGRLVSLGYPWPRGGDVTVVYTHGYDAVPDELARLCAALADKDLTGSLGVRSLQESIGTKSSSITYAATGESVFTPSEDRILDRYRVQPLP